MEDQRPGPDFAAPRQDSAPVVRTCYRHGDREAMIACQRCDRPICPECMREAAVGFQCPACTSAGRVRAVELPFGGSPSANPRLTSMMLAALNGAVFLLILATGGAASRWSDALALTPVGRCLATSSPGSYYPLIVDAATCRTTGDGTWQAGQASGAVWQVITSAFTHVGFMHIAFNMLALWMLGPVVEQILGRGRFLLIYLGSALTGSALVMWASSPTQSTLGASGAIFGLMGTYLLLVWKVKGDVRNALMWIGLNLIITFLPGSGISWQGHLGGLVGGLLLATIVMQAPRERRATWQWVGGGAVVALAAIAIVLRMAVLTA